MYGAFIFFDAQKGFPAEDYEEIGIVFGECAMLFSKLKPILEAKPFENNNTLKKKSDLD